MESVKSSEKETHFKSGSINFYVENSPQGFTFFEFKVDDAIRLKNIIVLKNL